MNTRNPLLGQRLRARHQPALEGTIAWISKDMMGFQASCGSLYVWPAESFFKWMERI